MKIKLFLVSVLALFLVSGCEEKNPSIATTVYPVQYLVERIGGDDVTVSNITENTMIQRAQIKSSFQDILDVYKRQWLLYSSFVSRTTIWKGKHSVYEKGRRSNGSD